MASHAALVPEPPAVSAARPHRRATVCPRRQRLPRRRCLVRRRRVAPACCSLRSMHHGARARGRAVWPRRRPRHRGGGCRHVRGVVHPAAAPPPHTPAAAAAFAEGFGAVPIRARGGVAAGGCCRAGAAAGGRDLLAQVPHKRESFEVLGLWRLEALQAHVVHLAAGGDADALVDTVVECDGAAAQRGGVPAAVAGAGAALGCDGVAAAGDLPAGDADGAGERHLEESSAGAVDDC